MGNILLGMKQGAWKQMSRGTRWWTGKFQFSFVIQSFTAQIHMPIRQRDLGENWNQFRNVLHCWLSKGFPGILKASSLG